MTHDTIITAGLTDTGKHLHMLQGVCDDCGDYDRVDLHCRHCTIAQRQRRLDQLYAREKQQASITM